MSFPFICRTWYHDGGCLQFKTKQSQYAALCHEAYKADKLYNATKQGLQTFLKAAQSRSKLWDPQNRDAVERVLGIANAEEQHLVWQRSCYASFTGKSHLCRPPKAKSTEYYRSGCRAKYSLDRQPSEAVY